jgi:hypothetical protein
MIQGMRIGVTMIALVLALFTLNALGISAVAGVDPGMGGMDRDDVGAINEQGKQAEIEGTGQEDPGFFGVAAASVRTFSQLWTLITNTSDILQSWSVPWPIAWSVQAMVDFVFIYGLYQIARGVNL